jgi:hypothetical protein
MKCAAHAKRLERGTKANEPIREKLSLRARCQDLALKFADADSDDDEDFERRWDAIEHALREYAPAVLGRRGGENRAAVLSPERRREIAKQGAKAWALGLSAERRAEIASIAAQARAAALSPQRRREIAKKATEARVLACRQASKVGLKGKRRTGGA